MIDWGGRSRPGVRVQAAIVAPVQSMGSKHIPQTAPSLRNSWDLSSTITLRFNFAGLPSRPRRWWEVSLRARPSLRDCTVRLHLGLQFGHWLLWKFPGASYFAETEGFPWVNAPLQTPCLHCRPWIAAAGCSRLSGLMIPQKKCKKELLRSDQQTIV